MASPGPEIRSTPCRATKRDMENTVDLILRHGNQDPEALVDISWNPCDIMGTSSVPGNDDSQHDVATTDKTVVAPAKYKKPSVKYRLRVPHPTRIRSRKA